MTAERRETYDSEKTTPWAHQVAGLELIKAQPATMLAYDMGTGKSRIIVDAVCSLELARTLIVCPKSVCDVWPAEFAKHGNGKPYVLQIGDGRIKDRAEKLYRALRMARMFKYTKQLIVVIVNYEAAWRNVLSNAIKSTTWSMVVADESQRAKAPAAKCSWFLSSLRARSEKRVALTGTPLPHSPLDAYAQYRFLDTSIFGKSFVRFRARYAIMGGYQNHQVVRFQNMDDFNEKFYSIARRVTKDEVLDLPDSLHETRYVQLGDEARRVYEDLKEHLIADVESGIVTAANAMVRMLRLQQVTSGFVKTEDGITQKIDDAKKKALVELFEDIGATEPIVCFGVFHGDLDQIKAAAFQARRPVFELSGRAKELEEWKRSTRGSVLAVQLKAGGVGIDLSKACYCVYVSTGFSLGDYEQSLARVHRPGQMRSVTYIHLLASNTIDTYVQAALTRRKSVIEYALRGLTHGSGDESTEVCEAGSDEIRART